MGSIPTPTKKLDALLPNPPKQNLVSHFILGEIIDHIHHIGDDFPEVKIDLLKRHLWDIRNKNVDPKVHLRGFLNVFEKTAVFQAALEELDDGMRVQLMTFMAGGGEEVVLAAGGKGNEFHLPPSPPVKHHFEEFTGNVEEKIEKIFHHEEHAPATNGHAVNGITNGHPHMEKVGEKIEKIFQHEEQSPAGTGNATNGGAVNGITNGHAHVEKVKEGLEKFLHHEKHTHCINGDAAIGDGDEFAVKEPSTHSTAVIADEFAVKKPSVNGGAFIGDADEFAVKEPSVHKVIDEHVATAISSTPGYPRIFEDKAETKTMEVGCRYLYIFKLNAGYRREASDSCSRESF
jgi:hypothetical protein